MKNQVLRNGHRLLILLVIMTLLLAGCAVTPTTTAGTTAGTTTGTTATTAAPTTTAAPAPAELIFAFPGSGNNINDLTLVETEINKYLKEKINTTVTLMCIGFGAWDQQIRLMLASKERLDVLNTGSIPGLFDYTNQVANKQLLALDDLLTQYGSGIKTAVGDFLVASKIGGKTYGIPTVRDLGAAFGIIMRKDLVEKYNIDLTKVKTLADMESVYAVIKEKEPDMSGLMDGSGGGAGVNMVEFFLPCDNLVDGNGILMDYGQNLTVVDEYATPEFAAVVDIFRKWYLAGYILPDAATTQENGSGMVKAGKMFSYPTMIKPGIDNQETKNCNYPMVSVTLTKASTGTFGACVFMMSITSYSKFPEQSMKFLNLMYTDSKLVNYFDWGIEGKHYVKTADGTIDYPTGVDAANTGYGLNEPFAFGNQMISYVWKGDSPDLYKQLDAFNKGVIKSKAMGFNFNNEPVKTEYASVSNVINQYKASVETGSVDPAKVLPEFIAALNAAGMQKIVAEKQKQLNAWALENNVK